MFRIFKQLTLVILICVSLVACNDKSKSPVTGPLNISTPASSYVLQLGSSVTVPVTFTASSGTISNLVVASLSALPHGWPMQDGGNTFTCATVPTNGTDCQLNLIFAPTNINQDNGTLILHYTYVNSNEQSQTGQFSIPYAVLNRIVPSINPTPSINTITGSTQNVFITFAASPSATTATDLTCDLSQLPADWSVIGGDNFFKCATVQGLNGCQLGLAFHPTAADQPRTLTLNYSYYDNSGTLQHSSLSFQYQATPNSTVMGNISASTVTQAVGSSLPASIAYTTNAGQGATNFRITSGLNNLNTLGWSGPSSFICPTVSNTNGCQLALNFIPDSFNQDGTLNLSYSYDDNNGSLQTGTTKINYSPTNMDTLQASVSPSPPIIALVSQSAPVTLTFTSNTAASDLQVTGLNNLPPTWRQINGTPDSFHCATVSAGNGCQLSLQFSPTDTASGVLTLGYSYKNNNGIPLTGYINLQYQGTTDNNAVYTANPPAPLATIIGNSYPVSVVFTTDDSQPATHLTMDLSKLTANNPGWSSSNAPTFTCSSFSTGANCTLALTYSPVTSDSSTLSLPYHYQDNNGNSKTETFDYNYTAGSANQVIATLSPPNAYGAPLGSATAVNVNFTTNDQYPAASLSLNLSSLSSFGWTAFPASSSFFCATVPALHGTGCSLTLTYTPITVTSDTALNLSYTYTANDGQSDLPGTLLIPYSAIVPAFAYVTNYIVSSNTNNILQCAVSTHGGLICTPTGNLPNRQMAQGIAIHTATNGTTYAYITFQNRQDWGRIMQCTLDNSNGNLSNCLATATGIVNGDFLGIAFHTAANGTAYAYIGDRNGNIWQCSIASNGNLSNCSPTPGFDGPFGIAFNTINDTTYAYVTNLTGQNISQCTVNFDGTLSPCSTTAADTFTKPYGIAFHTAANGTTYLYIDDDTAVWQCTLNADGSISTSSCTQAKNNPPEGDGDIAFYTAGDNSTYAYITTFINPSITVCPVNSDGSLGNSSNPCTTTGNGFTHIGAIAFPP